jgi:hypothetical protein
MVVHCPITTSRRSLPFISTSISSTVHLLYVSSPLPFGSSTFRLVYVSSPLPLLSSTFWPCHLSFGLTRNALFSPASSSRMVVHCLITTSRRGLPFILTSISSTVRLLYVLSPLCFVSSMFPHFYLIAGLRFFSSTFRLVYISSHLLFLVYLSSPLPFVHVIYL